MTDLQQARLDHVCAPTIHNLYVTLPEEAQDTVPEAHHASVRIAVGEDSTKSAAYVCFCSTLSVPTLLWCADTEAR